MEAVANGVVILVTIVAMIAIIVGALGGTIVWRIKRGRALGIFSVMGAYFLVAAIFLGFSWLTAGMAVILGLPSLILTFLISFLTAHYLETRANQHPIWFTLVTLGSALIAGFLFLLLLRFSFQSFIWITLGADAYLILLAIESRKLAHK